MQELVIRPDADRVLKSIHSAIDEANPDRNIRLVLRDMAKTAKGWACQALIDGDMELAERSLTTAVSCEAALAIVMFLDPEKLVRGSQEELAVSEPAPEPDGDDEDDSGAAQEDGPEVVLEDMSRAELLAHAKELGLKGLSQCTKEDILATIQESVVYDPTANES